MRFSSPGYSYALDFPGSPASWGIWIMLSGVGVVTSSLFGHRLLVIITLFSIASWSVSFAVCFLLSLMQIHEASGTGAPTYMYIGVLASCLAAAYMMPVKVVKL